MMQVVKTLSLKIGNIEIYSFNDDFQKRLLLYHHDHYSELSFENELDYAKRYKSKVNVDIFHFFHLKEQIAHNYDLFKVNHKKSLNSYPYVSSSWPIKLAYFTYNAENALSPSILKEDMWIFRYVFYEAHKWNWYLNEAENDPEFIIRERYKMVKKMQSNSEPPIIKSSIGEAPTAVEWGQTISAGQTNLSHQNQISRVNIEMETPMQHQFNDNSSENEEQLQDDNFKLRKKFEEYIKNHLTATICPHFISCNRKNDLTTTIRPYFISGNRKEFTFQCKIVIKGIDISKNDLLETPIQDIIMSHHTLSIDKKQNVVNKATEIVNKFAEETLPKFIVQNLKFWTEIFFADQKWSSEQHRKLIVNSFSNHEICIVIDPFENDGPIAF